MIVQPALQALAEKQIKAFSAKRRSVHAYVGASEVGMCLRRVKFSKIAHGGKRDLIEGWGASRRGVVFEDHFWVPAMRARYSKNILFTGAQQRSWISGDLRATPDGILINQKRDVLHDLRVDDIGPSGVIVLDCKTIDPRINLSGPKPEHEFQAQVQMGVLRAKSKYKPDYAVISYTNASFYDDVVEFAVKFDLKVFEIAKQRAAQVKHAKHPDELSPEGWIADGKECEYCPFAAPCREIRGDVPREKKVNNTDNLDRGFLEQVVLLAREERRWSAISGSAEEEQRKIQHTIKEMMKAHDLHRVAHDGVVVLWSPVKGRISFDMVALRAAAAKLGLDVQAFETVGQPTDRLAITENK